MKNNEANEVPKAPEDTATENAQSSLPAAAEPEENTQEIIVVNEETTELDLNHGRIGKIENLEPLKNLERYDIIFDFFYMLEISQSQSMTLEHVTKRLILCN